MHKTNTRIAVAEALVSVEFVTAIHGFRVKSTSGASIANVTTTRVLLPTNKCVLDQIMENVTAVSVSVDLDGRAKAVNVPLMNQNAYNRMVTDQYVPVKEYASVVGVNVKKKQMDCIRELSARFALRVPTVSH